jgi:thiosulfate/3-mercaptopyruvate sulfurtransferase
MSATTPRPDLPGGPLVPPEWLEEHLGHPRVRVLDVRGRHPSSPLPHAKRAEYDVAHVTGAVPVDWTRDFVDAADPVPFQLAPPDVFARRAGELGISHEDVVVTYDDYYGIFAGRVAWAFRHYGAEARILDGGWTSWIEQGRPTRSEPTVPTAAQFVPRPRPPLRLTLPDLDAARERGALVVDARPRHLYVGEPGVAGSGHIPGSVSLPYQELVDGATGLFAAPAAVRRLVRAAGIDAERPPAEIVTTCGSGVSATVALAALELAGLEPSGVYDGSWNEWSADPARPVAYGAANGAR